MPNPVAPSSAALGTTRQFKAENIAAPTMRHFLFYSCMAAESYPNSESKVDWPSMSHEMMLWFTGQMQSDGTIHISANREEGYVDSSLALYVEKASNAWSVLYVFRHLFGGVVQEVREERGNQQSMRRWGIWGWRAWELAHQLAELGSIKVEQYQEAADYY